MAKSTVRRRRLWDAYATMGELMIGLVEYFAFYNSERPHQALNQRTPEAVYQSAIGSGALIVDKFGGTTKPMSVSLCDGATDATTEARSESTAKTTPKANPEQRRPAANEVEGIT